MVVEEPSWEHEYVDAVYSAPTGDLEATVARCVEIAKQETEPITGVIAFVEHSVPAAAAVAAELGLPYISPETAEKSRDKLAMRTAFEKVGISQPRFALASSIEEAQEAALSIKYPLVMKPIIGGGSMFVRRVDNAEELAEHFEEIRAGAWAASTTTRCSSSSRSTPRASSWRSSSAATRSASRATSRTARPRSSPCTTSRSPWTARSSKRPSTRRPPC